MTPWSSKSDPRFVLCLKGASRGKETSLGCGSGTKGEIGGRKYGREKEFEGREERGKREGRTKRRGKVGRKRK